MIAILVALLFSSAASAETADTAAAPKAEYSLEYHLSELRPVSSSTYPTGAASMMRNYLQFRNEDGSHFLVVEEDSDGAPLKAVAGLQRAFGTPSSLCDVDLVCRKKAFCTGRCGNMYYQITNAPNDKVDNDRCRLVSFSCVQSRESPGAK